MVDYGILHYCDKCVRNLKSITGFGYIQSSPVFFIFPHIYNCPPPRNQTDQKLIQWCQLWVLQYNQEVLSSSNYTNTFQSMNCSRCSTISIDRTRCLRSEEETYWYQSTRTRETSKVALIIGELSWWATRWSCGRELSSIDCEERHGYLQTNSVSCPKGKTSYGAVQGAEEGPTHVFHWLREVLW